MELIDNVSHCRMFLFYKRLATFFTYGLYTHTKRCYEGGNVRRVEFAKILRDLPRDIFASASTFFERKKEMKRERERERWRKKKKRGATCCSAEQLRTTICQSSEKILCSVPVGLLNLARFDAV